METDDRKLFFEPCEFVGVVLVKEFDLVADILDEGFFHDSDEVVGSDGSTNLVAHRGGETDTW